MKNNVLGAWFNLEAWQTGKLLNIRSCNYAKSRDLIPTICQKYLAKLNEGKPDKKYGSSFHWGPDRQLLSSPKGKSEWKHYSDGGI